MRQNLLEDVQQAFAIMEKQQPHDRLITLQALAQTLCSVGWLEQPPELYESLGALKDIFTRYAVDAQKTLNAQSA